MGEQLDSIPTSAVIPLSRLDSTHATIDEHASSASRLYSFFVMLAEGCYHMTCKCGQGFCYLCSRPWKTCGCVHWDERHLEREARQRVEAGQRAAHAPALAPADYHR